MTAREPQQEDKVLTASEVAVLYRVDPKSVLRWAASGLIPSFRTPGGHRRFRESEIRALLAGTPRDGGES